MNLNYPVTYQRDQRTMCAKTNWRALLVLGWVMVLALMPVNIWANTGNVTDPGSIAWDPSSNKIISVAPASGGDTSMAIEYYWWISTPSGGTAGATGGESYSNPTPGYTYARCARRGLCLYRESNAVAIISNPESGECPSITITNATLPIGQWGAFYSHTFGATGGTGTNSWDIHSGSLPSGLTLSSAGALTGTPNTTFGHFNFIIRATDEKGCKAIHAVSVYISNNLASIGDRLWHDTDQDGIQDVGEFGVGAGSTISLQNSSGTTLATTTTDSVGQFSFNNLSAGTYRLAYTRPAQWLWSPGNVGGATEQNDSDVTSSPTANTGYTDYVTVASGQYYRDLDIGIYDAYDYGDLVAGTDYHVIGATAAHHKVDSTAIRLGATVDVEPDGLPTAGATGDDMSNTSSPDDEDGIAAFPAFVADSQSAVSISVLNSSGGSAYIHAFFDWNKDGDFLDASEVIHSAAIPHGTNGSVLLNVRVPRDAAGGSTAARFRLSNLSDLGPDGWGSIGEVEDYYVDVSSNEKFKVGNLVFYDRDKNGVRDANEPGIPNIDIELWSPGPDGRVFTGDDVAVTSGRASALSSGGMMTTGSAGGIKGGYSTLTATTDWNGNYEFADLSAGIYYLRVNPASKRTFSSQFGSGTITYNVNLDYPIVSPVTNFADDGLDDDNNGFQSATGFSGASDAVAGGVGADIFTAAFTLSAGAEPGAKMKGNEEFSIDIGLIPCPSIMIEPVTLPSATNGVAYTHSLAASGGTAPYSYTIVSGSLPSTMSMNGAGVITGTSGTNGSYNFTVRATDAQGCQGTATLRLAVCPPFNITTASPLPAGTQDVVYSSVTLAASGGTPPYSNWRIYSGNFPPGLGLTSGGVISGTPTASGTYTFQIAVDDSGVTGNAVTVNNPSFESQNWNGVPFVPQSAITGWNYGNPTLAGTGTNSQIYGVHNNIALYGNTSNGLQFVASPFVPSWLSQTISGLSIGAQYKVRFKYALRDAFPDPPPPQPPPPFMGDPVSIATYTSPGLQPVFSSIRYTTPPPQTQNFDTWTQLEFSFIPPTSAMVFSFDMEGGAIDMIEVIPVPTPTCTAVKTYSITINPGAAGNDRGDWVHATNPAGAQTTTTLTSISSNLKLGALVDAETSVTGNTVATVDDTTGSSDDEDAFLIQPSRITEGQVESLSVQLLNSTGANAYLNLWIDYNHDGAFNAAIYNPATAPNGERVIAPITIASSAPAQTVGITFPVPTTTLPGAHRGMRMTLTSSAVVDPTGNLGAGEIEDHTISICPSDLIQPETLPGGSVGAFWSQSFSAPMGTAPLSWSYSGSVPGLSFSGSTLSGTPITAGSYTITLKLNDAAGCEDMNSYTLTINPAAGGIVCPDPNAETLGASGRRWGYSSSSPPIEPGLSVKKPWSDYGVLAGTSLRLQGASTGGYSGISYTASCIASANRSHPSWGGSGRLFRDTGAGVSNGPVTFADTETSANSCWLPDADGNYTFTLQVTPSVTVTPDGIYWESLYNNITYLAVKVNGSIIASNVGPAASAVVQSDGGTIDLYYYFVPFTSSLTASASYSIQIVAGGGIDPLIGDIALLGCCPAATPPPLIEWKMEDGFPAPNGSISEPSYVNPCIFANNGLNSGDDGTILMHSGASINGPKLPGVNARSTVGWDHTDQLTLPWPDGSFNHRVINCGFAFENLTSLSWGNFCMDIRRPLVTAPRKFRAVLMWLEGSYPALGGVQPPASAVRTAWTNTYSFDAVGTWGTMNMPFVNGTALPSAAEVSGEKMVIIIHAWESGSGSGPTTALQYDNVILGGTATCAPSSNLLSLGDKVWNDANQNGVFDNGIESGISGLTVELLNGAGVSFVPSVTTQTTADGNYSFDNLPSGTYRVRVTPNAAFPVATTAVNLDNGMPNDSNGIQSAAGQPATSPVITLSLNTEPGNGGSGNAENTVDFGFHCQAQPCAGTATRVKNP